MAQVDFPSPPPACAVSVGSVQISPIAVRWASASSSSSKRVAENLDGSKIWFSTPVMSPHESSLDQ